jgi:hypothetical protein
VLKQVLVDSMRYISKAGHKSQPQVLMRDLRCTPFCRAWRPTGAAEKYANQS